MKLKEYIYLKRLKQYEVAEEIGISLTYLNEIINKKVKPSASLCEIIIDWSGRKVTYSDLLDW